MRADNEHSKAIPSQQKQSTRPATEGVIARHDLSALFSTLRKRGYRIIGPTIQDQTIVYDEVQSETDLPVGWTDEQNGGTYRLQRRDDGALFAYTVGPHSWKKYLHPPVVELWHARRTEDGMTIESRAEEAEKLALLGVRACELHAIAIQDRLFLQGDYVDPIYQARRQNIFIVAVQCVQAGNTCFCASMQTGPQVESDFDLALTEVCTETEHYFVIKSGSEQGAEVLRELPHRQGSAAEIAAADAAVARAAKNMGRRLDTRDLKNLLYDSTNSPRWDEVASRCLTCTNCTMVCPTCFCTTVEDVTNLTGTEASRIRKWDSCFTLDFSYIHGGSIRASAKSRYRQWITHKLATWIDQFGVSGCVGCGRCITWCPVGIDITEEIRTLRAEKSLKKPVS